MPPPTMRISVVVIPPHENVIVAQSTAARNRPRPGENLTADGGGRISNYRSLLPLWLAHGLPRGMPGMHLVDRHPSALRGRLIAMAILVAVCILAPSAYTVLSL